MTNPVWIRMRGSCVPFGDGPSRPGRGGPVSATLALVALGAVAADAMAPPDPTARVASAPSEKLAPYTLRGPWTRRPLVRKGDPAPGSGGQFQEFYEAYPLGPEHLLFWARYGPQQLDRGIYAWKAGVLKAVLTPSGKGWERSVGTWPGKGVAYLTRAREWSSVQVWDGERLTRLIGRGDAWKVRDTTYTLDSAAVGATNWNEGLAVLELTAKAPSALKAWVLHDGTRLTPLLAVGDTLPGHPGARVKEFQVQGIAWGAVHGRLDVEGADHRTALFALKPGQAEMILEVGGKDPMDGSKALRSAFINPSLEIGRAAFHGTRAWGAGKLEDILLIREGGSLRLAFEGPTSNAVEPRLLAWKDSQYDWAKYDLGFGNFLTGGRPDYVFTAHYSRPAGMRSELGSHYLVSEHVGFLMLYDGIKVTSLASFPLAKGAGLVRLRKVDGDIPGLLALAGGLGIAFVASDGKGVRATQVPEFEMADGSRVTLDQIIQWVKPGQAIGSDAEGLFLLESRKP